MTGLVVKYSFMPVFSLFRIAPFYLVDLSSGKRNVRLFYCSAQFHQAPFQIHKFYLAEYENSLPLPSYTLC